MLPRAVKGIFLACLCLVPAAAWAETYFEAAQRLLESGFETEARRSLELEIKLRPRNLEARYDLAVLLMRIDHREEATRLYQENMKRGWHLPTVVNLSAIYLKQGKRKAAIQLLEKATRKFRAEAVPWYLLASIAEQQKQFRKADKYYQKSLKADRKNGFAYIRYARFLASRHRLKTAITHAEHAARLLPGCAPCFNIEGNILRQNHETKRALIAYQKAVALSPNRAIRLNIIAMLDALGEHQRANMMKQALKADLEEPAP
ncbi:MAG: hypothetical protein Q9M27_02060 [Mariprofundaceae bacterium]|nr:hypothetical protein [Mariprofundaceae bacterium]